MPNHMPILISNEPKLILLTYFWQKMLKWDECEGSRNSIIEIYIYPKCLGYLSGKNMAAMKYIEESENAAHVRILYLRCAGNQEMLYRRHKHRNDAYRYFISSPGWRKNRIHHLIMPIILAFVW